MQSADLPARFNIPWANSAISPYIRSIPETPDPEVGAASLQLGFPPDNFLDPGAGGVPSFGADWNGIFNLLTKWARWQAAGGAAPYDSGFQAAIGGYPAGSCIASAVTAGLLWYSVIEDNTHDPDVAGTGWIPVYSFGGQRVVTASGALVVSVKDRFVGLNRTAGVATSSTTLPTTNLFSGYRIRFEDLAGNFQSFPLTVSPPVGTIAGLASFTCNVNRQSVEFGYYGSDLWSVDT